MRPAPTGNDTDNVVIPKHLRDVTIVEQKSQTTCSVWPQYTGYTVYRLYFVLPSLLFACFLHTQHTAVCSTSCICIKCLYYSCLFLFFYLKKKKGLPACRQSGLHIVHLHWHTMCECGWFWLAIYCFHGYKLIIGNSSLPVSAPSCSIFMWKNLMHFKMSSFG